MDSVRADWPAALAGVQPCDRLVGVVGVPIASVVVGDGSAFGFEPSGERGGLAARVLAAARGG